MGSNRIALTLSRLSGDRSDASSAEFNDLPAGPHPGQTAFEPDHKRPRQCWKHGGENLAAFWQLAGGPHSPRGKCHATFTLSAQGTYAYTDTQATDAYRFYRASINSLSLKSCNAVGYADITVAANVQRMIANPLNAVDNRISALLPNPANGTIVFKWNEATQLLDGSNYFFGWSNPDMTLNPGEGAIVSTGTATTFTFVGEYLQGYLINPVPSGFSIRASKSPVSGPVASGLGSPILEGDVVTKMINGVYHNYAYRSGFWIDENGAKVAEPVMDVGESFWIYKPTDWEQTSSVWP